jgi:hypothetical protein
LRYEDDGVLEAGLVSALGASLFVSVFVSLFVSVFVSPLVVASDEVVPFDSDLLPPGLAEE